MPQRSGAAARETIPVMSSPPARLRRGEVLAGASGAALLVVLWAVPWFTARSAAGVDANLDGWHALPILRWLILVTALTAVALLIAQATRRAPAVPVTLSVIVTALGLLSLLALVIRVPTADPTPQVGAFLGLAGALLVVVAGFLSLRDEAGWVPSTEHPVQRVALRSSGLDGH